MLPKEASVDELVRELNSPAFDPVRVVGDAVDGGRSVKEQHPAAVELTATLNAHSQRLAGELQAALGTLLKSEKRVPHEITLLRNDVTAVNTALAEKYPQLTELVQTSRRSPVLGQLDELQEVRSRLAEVQNLLELAQRAQPSSSSLSTAELQQLAAVFEGTPDEQKWRQSGYYSLINKIMH